MSLRKSLEIVSWKKYCLKQMPYQKSIYKYNKYKFHVSPTSCLVIIILVIRAPFDYLIPLRASCFGWSNYLCTFPSLPSFG